MIVLLFLFIVYSLVTTFISYRIYRDNLKITNEKIGLVSSIKNEKRLYRKETEQLLEDYLLLQSEMKVVEIEKSDLLDEKNELADKVINYEAEHKLLNQEIIKVYGERNAYRDTLMNSTSDQIFESDMTWSDNYEAEYMRNMGVSPEEISEEPF